MGVLSMSCWRLASCSTLPLSLPPLPTHMDPPLPLSVPPLPTHMGSPHPLSVPASRTHTLSQDPTSRIPTPTLVTTPRASSKDTGSQHNTRRLPITARPDPDRTRPPTHKHTRPGPEPKGTKTRSTDLLGDGDLVLLEHGGRCVEPAASAQVDGPEQQRHHDRKRRHPSERVHHVPAKRARELVSWHAASWRVQEARERGDPGRNGSERTERNASQQYLYISANSAGVALLSASGSSGEITIGHTCAFVPTHTSPGQSRGPHHAGTRAISLACLNTKCTLSLAHRDRIRLLRHHRLRRIDATCLRGDVESFARASGASGARADRQAEVHEGGHEPVGHPEHVHVDHDRNARPPGPAGPLRQPRTPQRSIARATCAGDLAEKEGVRSGESL